MNKVFWKNLFAQVASPQCVCVMLPWAKTSSQGTTTALETTTTDLWSGSPWTPCRWTNNIEQTFLSSWSPWNIERTSWYPWNIEQMSMHSWSLWNIEHTILISLDTLQSGHYAPSTDVWGWGVAMWEILTRWTNNLSMTNLARELKLSFLFQKSYPCFPRAQQPFPDVDPFEMEGYLVDGFRLHQPVNCPDQLYTVRKLSLTNL